MVYYKELLSRIQNFLRYNPHELSGLAVAILITGFIFSFRDWGAEQFDALAGLRNLFLVFIIATLSFHITPSS